MAYYVITLTKDGKTGKFAQTCSEDEFSELPYVYEYDTLPDRYGFIYVDGPEQMREVDTLPTVYAPDVMGMTPLDLEYSLWMELEARKEKEGESESLHLSCVWTLG